MSESQKKLLEKIEKIEKISRNHLFLTRWQFFKLVNLVIYV